MSEIVKDDPCGKRKTAKRQAGLELLRCVAMMMVIVLHYLGKGNLLTEPGAEGLSLAEYTAWLLESFCIVAVNVYMFISGYFLCTSSFKPSRLLGLWMQVWTYSVVFGLAGALSGVMEETAFDTHFLLTLIFPVSMNHYWFMTAYFFMYLLLPVLSAAVRRMTKKQLQVIVILFLFAFSVLKSVLPVRLETDGQGYDFLWYVCVFLAAAYVRRFGLPFLEKKGRGILLYAVCSLGVFGGTMALQRIYLISGRMGQITKICLEYNHVLPFLAAVGLFFAFRRLKPGSRLASAVNIISPCTLGVYLLHENLGLRYTWQNWLGAGALITGAAPRIDSVSGVLLHTVVSVICVFAAGIAVELLRRALMRIIDSILSRLGIYRRTKGFIYGLDDVFREKEGSSE